MTEINVHEAKTHLSRYLKRAAKGETIVVCLRNKPFARIMPMPESGKARRPIGLDKGKFKVPDDIMDPMPDWWIEEVENNPVFPRVPRKRK